LELTNGKFLTMNPGDYITIPARQKHRVVSTSETEPTVWLAVYFVS
jgi:cupin 2 domain-containing protein